MKTAAYLKGYSDGYHVGTEDNTYTGDIDRHEYRIGYDAGVAAYCYELDKDATAGV